MFGIALCITFVLMQSQPNLFLSLMATTGSMVAFSPLFVLCLMGRRDLIARRDAAITSFFAVFVITAVLLFRLSAAGEAGWMSPVVVVACL